jgi:uncharacterized protein YkwD
MNLLTVVRPAQHILAATLVAAVASTCIVSTSSSSTSPDTASHAVQAKKEYRIGAPATADLRVAPAKKEYVAPGKKEYVVPAKKEYAAPGKKEYVVPAKKEYVSPGKKEYVVVPAKKEYAAPGKKEYVSPVALVGQPASPALSTDTYEARVLARVNAARAHHGRRALTLAPCAVRVANRWSAHLASTGAFVHQSMQKLLRRCDAHYVGETLGRGAMTPKTLVSLWMHSAPHRHVLLSRSPRRIGIGATPDADGQWLVAANFMHL